MPITLAQFKTLFPACKNPDPWPSALNAAFDLYQINEPAVIAALLAQFGHECQSFNRLEENLNYSAEGLMKTWPKRFPSLAFAKEYERQPEKIANLVYSLRGGNGPPSSGDGWKYRGRGCIMVTFRDNYRDQVAALNLPLLETPELLAKPDTAARSGVHYCKKHGLIELASANQITALSAAINTGTPNTPAEKVIGLKERLALTQRAKEVFSA
jgi:putative chitinase